MSDIAALVAGSFALAASIYVTAWTWLAILSGFLGVR